MIDRQNAEYPPRRGAGSESAKAAKRKRHRLPTLTVTWHWLVVRDATSYHDIRMSGRPPRCRRHEETAMPPRIVLIGAGSVTFTRNLLADFLAHPALRGSDLVLHDIDSDRLRTAERMARWTAQALGAEPRIEAHLDRPTALRGADIVVNTIQVGGERATRIDFQVPARYGLRYTINDTINVGGVFRALRTIPVVLGLTRDMETICPDAWLLNYTNPMSSLMWAIAKSSGVRAVGLCHSVYWSVRRIAHYLGLPPDELEAVSGGI
ncbi:MAG: hypothetical protein C4307_00020, partial [Chloroflexota bacterium]